MAKPTWYDKGYEEGTLGLPSDPPMHPGHRSYKDYLEGYKDGQWWLENNS